MVSPMRKLVRGGSGFFIISPIYHEGHFKGFIEKLIDPGRLVSSLAIDLKDEGFSIWLAGENSSEVRKNDRWFFSIPLTFHENSWNLMALPGPKWVKSKKSMIPIIVLMVGMVVSILLALLARLVQKNWDRTLEVQKARAKLKDAYNSLEAQSRIVFKLPG